ncbi:MAG: hypothetical protein PVI33_03785 [Candidatus Omnitrophota bacterium]|jgi:chromosome segregation ATPase
MKRLLKVISIFLLILALTAPLSESQFDESNLKEAWRQAISLYKRGEYNACLAVLDEIKLVAPNWQAKKVDKYVKLCEKKIEALRQKSLTKPQDSWWELMASEEFDQPERSSIEGLFTDYADLKKQLERKETKLQLLNQQLKQLQTDSAALHSQQLARENSLLKIRLKSYEENLEDLKKENLEVSLLQKQLIALNEQIKQKDSAINSLNIQLAKLQGSTTDQEKDYLSLKKAIDAKTEEFNLFLKEKDTQISALDEQVISLRQMLEEAKKIQNEKYQLAQQVESLNSEIDQLKDELQSKDNLIQQARLEKQQLSEELKEKEGLIKQANQRLIEVNQEVNSFKSEIDELKNGLKQRGKTTQAASAAVSWKEEQEKTSAQIEKLQKELSFTLEKYKLLEQDSRLMEKDYKALQRQLTDKEKNLRIAQKNYDALQKKLADSERYIAQLKKRGKARAETSKVKDSPAEENRIRQLTAEINRKNQLLAQKEAEISSLKQTIQNTYSLFEDISGSSN